MPDNEHSKKKEEIYLGLEKVAVAENSTHDEDGEGERAVGWGTVSGGRGLFIYLD
jgi:hypothetical protein